MAQSEESEFILLEVILFSFQLTEREVKDYSKPQICDQGAILNTAIDIPNRKDKEDLTESSEV